MTTFLEISSKIDDLFGYLPTEAQLLQRPDLLTIALDAIAANAMTLLEIADALNLLMSTSYSTEDLKQRPDLVRLGIQILSTESSGPGGDITASQISDASANGRSLIKATNYDAMLALLSITASDITDASANGRSLLTATNYAAMRSLLAITAADITDASPNGRSLLTATNYAAMRSLLAITAADITDASANGRSLITATNYAAMRSLLAIAAADITDASANGRSLITATNYAAMRSLLDVGQIKITKPSNESRTNTTTNTSDLDFAFPVDANSTYEVDIIFTLNGTAAAGGLRAALTLPAGAEAIMNARNTANTTQHVANGSNQISSVITAAQMLATQICWFTARVRTAGTAGTVAFAWSQNVSSANPVTIAADGILNYRKL